MDPLQRLLALAADAGLSGIEQGTSYGTPSLKRKGQFLARLKDETTLVIRCPLDEKDMLMAAEPGIYFQTDHYVGYPAVLVRLDVIDDARLIARLERACLMQAEKRTTRSTTRRRRAWP
jgi:hypothetical protein